MFQETLEAIHFLMVEQMFFSLFYNESRILQHLQQLFGNALIPYQKLC